MSRPYVITISSEKGGVGKTTLATNLAIYLKAVAEDLPVTLLSFDNHFSVDKMFRIGRSSSSVTVADIFSGSKLQDLIETGEYGIQYIPSSAELNKLRSRITTHEILAQALADSQLEGVVIIDTRPDLDIFTCNALYAADRVIVPVKDAPSLENCRHIYDFFDDQNLPRQTVKVLPCLIDQRIHYKGPFKTSYDLMRAFAINRGYSCFDGYVSKSPKVESLNTNPEGKIFPVLTHAENTDVHTQFTALSQVVYRDLLQSKTRRVDDVRRMLVSRQQRRDASYVERRRLLAPGCLLCGSPLVDEHVIRSEGAFYAETSTGEVAGYLEESCFTNLVLTHVFGADQRVENRDALHDLLRESAQRCYFVLRRAPHTRGFYEQKLSFYRFDENGLELSHKQIALPRDCNTPLQGLAQRTLFDPQGRLADHFLLVRRVSSDFPEGILYDEHYQRFLSTGSHIAHQLLG